jgi:hypothetical protein
MIQYKPFTHVTSPLNLAKERKKGRKKERKRKKKLCLAWWQSKLSTPWSASVKTSLASVGWLVLPTAWHALCV